MEEKTIEGRCISVDGTIKFDYYYGIEAEQFIQLITSHTATCRILTPADCTISSLSQSGMFRKSMVFVQMSSLGDASAMIFI